VSCNAGQTGAELPQDLDDRSFKFFNKILDAVVDRAHDDDELPDQTSLGKELLQEFEAQVQLAKERFASTTSIKSEGLPNSVDCKDTAQDEPFRHFKLQEGSHNADAMRLEAMLPLADDHHVPKAEPKTEPYAAGTNVTASTSTHQAKEEHAGIDEKRSVVGAHVDELGKHAQNAKDKPEEAGQHMRQDGIAEEAQGAPWQPHAATINYEGVTDTCKANGQRVLPPGRSEAPQPNEEPQEQKQRTSGFGACSGSDVTMTENADGNRATPGNARRQADKHAKPSSIALASAAEGKCSAAVQVPAPAVKSADTVMTNSENNGTLSQRAPAASEHDSDAAMAVSDDEAIIPRRTLAAPAAGTEGAALSKHARLQSTGPDTAAGVGPAAGGHSASAKGHASFRGHSDSAPDTSALSAHELMKPGDEVEGSSFRRAVFWHWNNLEYGCSADLDWVCICNS
jgi:hypothetical protein